MGDHLHFALILVNSRGGSKAKNKIKLSFSPIRPLLFSLVCCLSKGCLLSVSDDLLHQESSEVEFSDLACLLNIDHKARLLFKYKSRLTKEKFYSFFTHFDQNRNGVLDKHVSKLLEN